MFRQFRVAALALGLAASLPQFASASIMTFEVGGAAYPLDLTTNSPYSGVSFIGTNSSNPADDHVLAVSDPDDPSNQQSNILVRPQARTGNHAIRINGTVTIVTSGFKFKGIKFDWYQGLTDYLFPDGSSCTSGSCFGGRSIDPANSQDVQTLWGRFDPSPSATGYPDAEYWTGGPQQDTDSTRAVLVDRITFSGDSYLDNIEFLGVEFDSNNNAPEPGALALALAALGGVAVTRKHRADRSA